jgi:hypothetical protein
MSCALEGGKVEHCDVLGHENVESDNSDLPATVIEVASEPPTEVRIFLNINTRADHASLLELLRDGAIVRIYDIQNNTHPRIIKKVVHLVKSRMNGSNRLEIDVRKIDESMKYALSRFIAGELGIQDEYCERIPICIIAKPELHESIKKFGIDVSLPDNTEPNLKKRKTK